MARIRSIHPGLSSDESYMSMTMAAKAAWPMLWTECDDQGVFEWKPIVLKARIFPADNVDFGVILAEYEMLNCVKSFTVNGKKYGIVRNFRKFQRPKKPNSIHPTPQDFSTYSGIAQAEEPQEGNQYGTGGGIPPQMEDGGCRMEDGGCDKEVPQTPNSKPDLLAVVDDWNAMAAETGLPKVQRLTTPRTKSLIARLAECGGTDGMAIAIGKVRDSPFLCGRNPRGWKADFDFILQPKSFTKLMEGSYDRSKSPNNSGPSPLDKWVEGSDQDA